MSNSQNYLSQLYSIKTEEELKGKGFLLKGPIVDWDVYDEIMEWENEDGIVVLTANLNGEFFCLGEKTNELLCDIVNDSRLGRLLREAILPEDNEKEGIFGYIWAPLSDETKKVLADNPKIHVYNVLIDNGNYRIVPMHIEGCIEIGYIFTEKQVDLGGVNGVLVRVANIYPL